MIDILNSEMFEPKKVDGKYKSYRKSIRKRYYDESNEIKILNEKIDVYREFIIKLCYNLTSTFFGMAFYKNEKDIEGHYDWGFNKTINQFKGKKISFKKNSILYKYFNTYFHATLYTEISPTYNDYYRFWTDLFNKDKNKHKHELDELIYIYNIFEKSKV